MATANNKSGIDLYFAISWWQKALLAIGFVHILYRNG